MAVRFGLRRGMRAVRSLSLSAGLFVVLIILTFPPIDPSPAMHATYRGIMDKLGSSGGYPTEIRDPDHVGNGLMLGKDCSVSGVEGTSVTLDASCVFGPPPANARHRWDLDSDGAWDTEWLSTDKYSHTWGDDYNDSVRVTKGSIEERMDISVEGPLHQDGALSWLNWLAQAFVPAGGLLTKVAVYVSVNWGDPSNLHVWIRDTLDVAGSNLSHGEIPHTLVPRSKFTGPDEWPIVDLDDVLLEANHTYYIVLGMLSPSQGIYEAHGVGDLRPEWPLYGGSFSLGWITEPDDDIGFRTYIEIVNQTTEGEIQVVIHNSGPMLGRAPYIITPIPESAINVFSAMANDSGSDDLTFTWGWGDGSSTNVMTFYNDGVGLDPYPSPDGTYPFSATSTITHIYGDNGVFPVTLTVKDDDGGFSFYATNVTVLNVSPTIDEAACTVSRTPAEAWARIAGEKWHDVRVVYYENGIETADITMTRVPGSPNAQEVFLGRVDHSSGTDYAVAMWYSPEDDSVNGQPEGATPAWIILKLADGNETKIHHLFNVNHPETWTWNVDNVEDSVPEMVSCEAVASDPGSDDIIFVWDAGDGRTFTTVVYNNGVGPDPYPSPEVNSITATSSVTFSRPALGHYTVTLTVLDDDGGSATRTLSLLVSPAKSVQSCHDSDGSQALLQEEASVTGSLLSQSRDHPPLDPSPRIEG